MAAKTYHPDELLAQYRQIRDSTTAEEFFRKPGMSRAREMWCAAHFSRAFNQHVEPCAINIDDVDTQDDADFDLSVNGTLYPFQVAEVLEPGRRRSDEYKDFVAGRTHLEDWSTGTELGAEWVRQAIKKKLQKNYSREAQLNLLLYLNFPAYDQNYYNIRDHCLAEASKFASTWLLSGNALACLIPHPQLKCFEGWLQIPQSLVYDEP